jgi:hypothetical protein
MPWGNVDNAANSCSFSVTNFNKAENTTNRNALFGNTTAGAIVAGKTVGQFGLDATEVGVSNGSIISIPVNNPGSGYFTAPLVTITGTGTATSSVNASGRVTAFTVTAPGTGYSGPPIITVAPPSKTFNPSTDVNIATDKITIAGNVFQDGDRVTYIVSAGNTAITPLSNNTPYFVVNRSAGDIQLSLAPGSVPINITAVGPTETGHNLVGQNATGTAVVSGLRNKGCHAGWVVRTEGTGGRAGRVHFETMVAMGSMSGDAADDIIAKDS